MTAYGAVKAAPNPTGVHGDQGNEGGRWLILRRLGRWQYLAHRDAWRAHPRYGVDAAVMECHHGVAAIRRERVKGLVTAAGLQRR